jgi:hypothetical protein
MVRFSITLAAGCPVYVGMALGAFMMVRRGNPALFPIGLFFGGAAALPLCASNGVAAIATRWLTAGQPFAIQFAVFVLLGAGAYYLMLSWLHRVLRTLGGLIHGRDGWAKHFLFFGASAALALAAMILASRNGLHPGPI